MYYDEHINAACSATNMNNVQLDALFTLARYIYTKTSQFKQKLVEICKTNFKLFDESDNYSNNITFLDDFLWVLVDNLFEKWYVYNELDKIDQFIKIFKDAWFSLNDSTYFFENKHDKLIIFAKMIDKEMHDNVDLFLRKTRYIFKLCIKSILSSDELSILQKFVNHYYIINCNYDDDEVITSYYNAINAFNKNDNPNENLNNLWDPEQNSNYDMSNFWNVENDQNVCNINGFSGNNYNQYQPLEEYHKTIKNKLKTIGFSLVKELKHIEHDVLDCIVDHNFCKNKKTLILLICDILKKNKNVYGYIDKFDKLITLHDLFIIINAAYDNNVNYDNSVRIMEKTCILSPGFPVELLLKIISRHYNTIITLYTEDLNSLFIDNAIGESPKWINIFKYSCHSYYNIIPIGETFVPSGNDEPDNIASETIMNDLSDIVTL
jgi:hypothetical protein